MHGTLGSQDLKITFMNVRSIKKHFEDMKQDAMVMKSDVITVAETWLKDQDEAANYMLDGRKMIGASRGKGKGVQTYWKTNEQSIVDTVKFWDSYNTNTYQLTKLTTSDGIDIITVYSQSGSNLQGLTKKVRELSVNKRVIIMGDFNFPANSDNIFTEFMDSSGFNQLIDRPTHDSGGTIDHLYVRNVTVKHFLHPLYFSDHSAISVMIE